VGNVGPILSDERERRERSLPAGRAGVSRPQRGGELRGPRVVCRRGGDYPRAVGPAGGSDWWDTVNAARDAGAPIPEYDRTTDTEPVAVLPPSVRDLSTAASGWDWRHAGTDTDLTIDAVRDRTAEAIGDAYGSGDRVLIEALPTMGKSYGSVLAAAETGEPVTVLTQRGHKEQYAQLREWCDERGLTYKTLPSFTRDCETANGEHGEEWADRSGVVSSRGDPRRYTPRRGRPRATAPLSGTGWTPVFIRREMGL